MRTRVTIAALTGTLALASLPASAAGQAAVLTDASNIVVNGGKPVVVGASGTTSVPVTMTVTGPAGKTEAGATLFHGANSTDAADARVNPGKGCGVNSATTFTCRMTFAFTARQTVKKNAMAGVWGVHAWAAGDANAQIEIPVALNVVRAAKLTVDASPEPVKYGKTLTITGQLTRANWETGKYAGNTNQTVKLQFRAKQSDTYTTITTVRSGTDGALKATATASADGYWRWSFDGTHTTGPATATADYVDVR